MRHRVYGNKLGRNKNERTTLFRGLVQALITYGTIETSQTKAKAIKGEVDKVINLAKDKRTQHLAKAFLVKEHLTDRLVKEIVPLLNDRTSGYTSVVKIGNRLGDNSRVVRMSIIGVEKLEPIKKGNVKTTTQILKTEDKKEEPKKTTRVARPARKAASKK